MRLFSRRQLDSRSRRILGGVILCLFSGSAIFEAGSHSERLSIFHGLPFLVIGLGVILLLRSARRSGRTVSRP